MKLPAWLITLLRVLLALLFAGLLVGQTMSIPGQFAHMASESPDQDFLRWPLTIFGILEVLCVQVVIVATWKLLTMVQADRIFSRDAFVWVDAIVWAIASAWVLLAGMSLTLILIIYFSPERDPGLPVMLVGMTLLGSVFVLVMVVLRALLRQAAALRTDLDAVI